MNSSVVSFFRFGSTEFTDTVLAGLAADQLVLADSGVALSMISPSSATWLRFASIHGYRSVVEPTGLIVLATPPLPTCP